MDLAALKSSSLKDLEKIYADASSGTVPAGRYWGHHLMRFDVPGQRRPLYPVSRPFAFVPFGVDFDSRCWFFLHPSMQIGRFQPRVGPSKWRETDVVALEYHTSRLPGFMRSLLYDEVQPLSDTLCLGIGGINRETGEGDHFFFALERI